MAPGSPSLVTTVLDGKFQIERALASGAAGDVYEATNLALGSRVAVKVLRDSGTGDAELRRGRFLREARLAAGIQSDHVVRVFDFAAHEAGPAYLVMELLQGETLAERVRRAGPLAMAEAVDYVVQAATPLVALHEAGIVHRDVKPSNLFLARDSDGKVRVKLLDFGVAAFRYGALGSESSVPITRAMIGTPRYMAPEQIRSSGKVDARADVWALGVTLYELLAGRPPFDAASLLAVLRHIERKPPVPLRERRPSVPAPVAAVVQCCLEKDPDKRPANARALLAMLTPLRASLEGMERVDVTGDALDLSWNDPDVEELRPVRRAGQKRAAITAGVLCVLAGALALGARSPRVTAVDRSPEPAPAVAAPQAMVALTSQPPAPSSPPAAEAAPKREVASAPRPISSQKRTPAKVPAVRASANKAPAVARTSPVQDEPLE